MSHTLTLLCLLRRQMVQAPRRLRDHQRCRAPTERAVARSSLSHLASMPLFRACIDRVLDLHTFFSHRMDSLIVISSLVRNRPHKHCIIILYSYIHVMHDPMRCLELKGDVIHDLALSHDMNILTQGLDVFTGRERCSELTSTATDTKLTRSPGWANACTQECQ